jgi:hypothetical protein
MNNAIYKIFPLLATLGFVSQCSDNSGHAPYVKTVGKTNALVAVWKSECADFRDEGDGSFTSEQKEVDAKDSEIEFSITMYKDKGCAEKTKWFTRKVLAKYATATEANTDGTTDIDTEIVKMFNQPHTDDEARALNRKAKCGYKNWKKGEAVDVTELPCGSSRPANKGDKGYDIYKIDAEKLQFGLNMDDFSPESELGRSKETRPKTLNDYIYTKSK